MSDLEYLLLSSKLPLIIKISFFELFINIIAVQKTFSVEKFENTEKISFTSYFKNYCISFLTKPSISVIISGWAFE